MFKKIMFSLCFFSLSCMTQAAEQHHNLSVATCRALPSGDIQILGVSDTDNQTRSVLFSTSVFKEKVLDRYLSLCLASLTSSNKLRLDYLDCTGTTCSPTTNSSLNFYK